MPVDLVGLPYASFAVYPVMDLDKVVVHPGYLSDSDLLLVLDTMQVSLGRDESNVQDVIRYNLLVAEIILRRLADIDLLSISDIQSVDPFTFPVSPYRQFGQLRLRYQDGASGRIPLPANAQQLWSQHKYSIMARDVNLYKQLGKQVAQFKPNQDYAELAYQLTTALMGKPNPGGIQNALLHMWGYVSTKANRSAQPQWSAAKLLAEIQLNTLKIKQFYLLSSTALSELYVWITAKP